MKDDYTTNSHYLTYAIFRLFVVRVCVCFWQVRAILVWLSWVMNLSPNPSFTMRFFDCLWFVFVCAFGRYGLSWSDCPGWFCGCPLPHPSRVADCILAQERSLWTCSIYHWKWNGLASALPFYSLHECLQVRSTWHFLSCTAPRVINCYRNLAASCLSGSGGLPSVLYCTQGY